MKHNGGNKTDREKIAKSLVYAKATGMNLPTEQLTAQLNLPPGIIYSAAEQAGITLDEASLKKMEEDLRRQNVIKEKEMKKAELIKTKKIFVVQADSV